MKNRVKSKVINSVKPFDFSVWINCNIRFETPAETLGVGIIGSGDYFESVKKIFFSSRISRIFVRGRRRPREVMKKKVMIANFTENSACLSSKRDRARQGR